METVERINKVLNCPCCYDFPKTGAKNEIGLCENGHICCYPCYQEMARTKTDCPVCRSKRFTLTTSHYTVNGILTILSAITLYSCKYEGCSIKLVGQAIHDHEMDCEHKPLKCPKVGCQDDLPLHKFLEGNVECIEKIFPHPFQQTQWHMTLQLDEIFSMNAFRISVTKNFRPKLLVNQNGLLPSSHLYVNVCSFTPQSVIIYVASLNPKDDTPTHIRDRLMHISVSVYTKVGKIGFSNIGPILFPKQSLKHLNEGVYLTQNTIIDWLRWTRINNCAKCPNHQPLHMHIVVSNMEEIKV